MRTMEQKRSQFALNKILTEAENGENKELSHFLSGISAQILQNGMGQSVAFWMAKGGDKHIFFLTSIVEWLGYTEPPDINNTWLDNTDIVHFIQSISQMDQSRYLEIQKEIIALSNWLKRYGKAYLE